MVMCKLCHKETTGCKTDKNLCSVCHKDLTRYGRLKGKKLEAHQKVFIQRMEKMFIDNFEHNGFVPKSFIVDYPEVKCETCNTEFKPYTKTKCCPKCVDMKHKYYALHRSDPKSKTLNRYDLHYKTLAENGRVVPKLFYDRGFKV